MNDAEVCLGIFCEPVEVSLCFFDRSFLVKSMSCWVMGSWEGCMEEVAFIRGSALPA